MRDYTIERFLDELSSKAAVPGGGGASALAGALGAALGNMVCYLTIGKKKYADVEAEVLAICEQGEALRMKLTELVEEDAVAFEPLSKAYGLPKNTDEEKAYRDEVMEKALLAAGRVPLSICRTVCEVIDLLDRLSEIGSRLAISDVGCAALFCKTALQGGALNVKINTKLMKDREVAEEMDSELVKLLGEYAPKAERIYERVMGSL